MIKKILSRFQVPRLQNGSSNSADKNSSQTPAVQANLNIIPFDKHSLDDRDISDAAMNTIDGLREGGYQAYLVGGGVRDLLLGLHPKDFDISTNATPEQVVKLFRNARVIGRRFKIAHVRFGREVIEVTTFRGHHHNSDIKNEGNKKKINKNKSQEKTAKRNKEGMLLRDNVYGSMEEDALRRDFTVNALYYCIDEQSIYDYTGGINDLAKKQLSIIGNPEQRYREDPVRMLRAVRLAAKLNFSIEEKTAQAIAPLSQFITEVPAARLFDEMLKLFAAGYAERTLKLLQGYKLFDALFPHTHYLLNNPSPSSTLDKDYYPRFITLAMQNTDERINNNKRITPAYLFAAFLWPVFQHELNSVRSQNNAPPLYQAQHIAADQTISQLVQRISLPKRFSVPMKEIWQLQFRLANRHGNRAQSLRGHQRFRAGYDFVLLREAAGENLDGLGQWWTDYQDADENTQQQMADQVVNTSKPRKRRSRNKRISPPK